jgi:hypothetical protein
MNVIEADNRSYARVQLSDADRKSLPEVRLRPLRLVLESAPTTNQPTSSAAESVSGPPLSQVFPSSGN